MYVVLDDRGRRMVMPRSTPEEAIKQIARALAGRGASTGELQRAWQKLLERGYQVHRVLQPRPARATDA